MAMVINTNISSLNAQRTLGASGSKLATAMERLSSGLRINSAKDDAAGLAISSRMTTQITGLNVAQRNANDGISLAQTAEGALSTIESNLQRIRELAVQSSNATNSASDRAALQKEVDALTSEIDRVAEQTAFNGTKLLDGKFTAQKFQIGANQGEQITIDSIGSARTSVLGVYNGINVKDASIGTANDATSAKTLTVGATNYSLGTIASDAKAVANAINASGAAGVQATAGVTTVDGATTTITATANGVSTIKINGTQINLTGTGNAASNRANAVEAINSQSAQTGVTAVDDGTGVKLEAADGRNITVSDFTAGGNTTATIADFGLGAGTTGAKLSLRYEGAATGNVALSGLTAPAAALTSSVIGQTGNALKTVSVKTADDASDALAIVDAALASVSGSRAALGAIQNRFESVVSNLATTAENLTASRSRILDTDFAQETANLSSAQVLQQAGTAMVAQANQLPQNVLSLLR